MNHALSSAPADAPSTNAPRFSRVYAWAVFALTFGLMLSDYLSRQVIGAVFPALKAEWALSDSQLGMLVSVVSLVVGLLTVPVSLIADRWGRVKSITLMAFVWCLATIACGLAQSYTQLLGARAIVGLGEAAYGAAGGALLAHVFPVKQRAAVLGAFLSAGLFGAVLGVVLGGIVASEYSWRMAFFAVGAPGLLLAIVYPFVVRDYKTVPLTSKGKADAAPTRLTVGGVAREVFAARAGNFTLIASGLQSAIPGIIIAWVPTYLSRYYDMDVKKAGLMAGVAVLVSGIGMLFGGGLAGQAEHSSPAAPGIGAGRLFCAVRGALDHCICASGRTAGVGPALPRCLFRRGARRLFRRDRLRCYSPRRACNRNGDAGAG